ncbi:LamG-like jellyroll fold domain-containing protein [Pontiella sulfatireligans]|uniref:Uncharacterized protein n=1 Tax=Pontiella sulfatireligans TaxID=2750658 RepID=A0A6C2UQT1_9BACT|nr:LamG-like jellyroll fold domain-containing protein [Pontiella sulfatireligans]VGO21654.1 hypothetical protein SCARR_03728 [Pontiella sulfatireligans]
MVRRNKNGIPHVVVSLAAFLFLGLAMLASSGCSPEPRLSGGEELFQKNTRIAWVRQIGGVEGNDPFCVGENLVLMGQDRNGERRILREEGSYRKPLFTPDGEGVVFSSYTERAFYYVNWDGSALRKLAGGSAVEVWCDPTGSTWVYYMDGELLPDVFSGKPVKRCRLDDPSITELVWEKTLVSTDNFQLSADGTKAAGLFPWPQVGMVDLPSQTLYPMGKGCWTSMSPDNRYLMWYFDGSHKKLVMRSFDRSIRSKVRINTMPEAQRHEVYHPRWSNHPRFFAMTGPYRQMGKYNAITGGGEGINLYVGKFDPDYRRVECWYQVTDNPHADFYPDLWMETISVANDVIIAQESSISPRSVPPVEWPENREGLVYVWRDGKSINGIEASGIGYHRCNAVRKGKARYGRSHEMEVSQGYFSTDGSDAMLADAVQKSRAFTVAVNVRPALDQAVEEGAIFSKGNVALFQSGTKLSLQTGYEFRIQLGQIEPGKDHFLAITCNAEGGIQYYLQSKPVEVPDAAVDYNAFFKGFGSQPLTFGALASGQADWSGCIDGIAWYDRVLAPAEIAEMYAAFRAEKAASFRDEPPRLVIDAKLVEISPTPSPEGIAPYRSALVEYLYEIEQVLEGRSAEKRIIVQHWVILDAVVYPLDREAGTTYRLVLESVDDHPELEGERISSELIEPVDVYLDVDWE